MGMALCVSGWGTLDETRLTVNLLLKLGMVHGGSLY